MQLQMGYLTREPAASVMESHPPASIIQCKALRLQLQALLLQGVIFIAKSSRKIPQANNVLGICFQPSYAQEELAALFLV